MRFSANQKQTLALFLFSVTVSVGFLALLPTRFQENEGSDYATYYAPAAQSLLAGRGYRLGDGSFVTRYPPGYPLVLSAIFLVAKEGHIDTNGATIAFGVLSMAITSILLLWTARGLWGSGAAWLAPVGWATYPFALWLLKQPNSETAFIPLLAAATFLFLPIMICDPDIPRLWPRAALAGILAGASMLIRPIALGLPLVLAALLLSATRFPLARRLSLGAALLCGAVVVVAPWEIWLVSRAGHPLPLASNGPASIRDGFKFPADIAGGEPIPIPADVRAAAQTVLDAPSGSLRDIAGVVMSEFRIHPVAVLKLAAIKPIRAWYATYSFRYQSLVAAIQLPYVVCLVIGGWRAFLLGGSARKLAIAVTAISGYFWFMSTMVAGLLRYGVPAISLLMLLAPALLVRSSKMPSCQASVNQQ